MKLLIDDWKAALLRLWSAKLMLLDMALMSANEWLPALEGKIPNSVFIVLTAAAFIARFVRQPQLAAGK